MGVRATTLPTITLFRGLWESLGYASSLSQQVALWFLPLGVAGPLFLDRARLGGSLIEWIVIALDAQVSLMVAFEIARRVIHRKDPEGSRPYATLVAIVIACLLRGAVIALLADNAELSSSIELAYRLVGGVTIVICLVIRERDVHRELVAALDSRLASLAILSISMQGRLAEINRGIGERVAAKMGPLVEHLDRTLDEALSGADVTASVEYIGHVIDDVLRPFSHELVNDRQDPDLLVADGPPVAGRPKARLGSMQLGGAIFPKICAAIVILVAPTSPYRSTS